MPYPAYFEHNQRDIKKKEGLSRPSFIFYVNNMTVYFA